MAPPTKTSCMLVTGEYFDHLNPDPAVINLTVLEHGLQAPRFNNQTVRPISIAEHSLRVRRIARELLGRLGDEEVEKLAAVAYERARASYETKWNEYPQIGRDGWYAKIRSDRANPVELWALLHDAHEALTPWGDCLRPGKTDHMREVEASIDAAIFDALKFWPSGSDREIVKLADEIALYFEAMLWMPGASDWAPPIMRKLDPGCSIDRLLPLIAPRPGESWRAEVEALLGKQPGRE